MWSENWPLFHRKLHRPSHSAEVDRHSSSNSRRLDCQKTHLPLYFCPLLFLNSHIFFCPKNAALRGTSSLHLCNFLSPCHLPDETSASLMLLYTFQLFLHAFFFPLWSFIPLLTSLLFFLSALSQPYLHTQQGFGIFYSLILFATSFFFSLCSSLVMSLVWCPTTQAWGKVRWASEVQRNNNNRMHPAKGTLSHFH